MTDHAIVTVVVFTTLVILLLIAGVAITIFIANRQRIHQAMRMTQMRLDYEKEMRTVQDEIQEQVLANVSRELHDNIGQLLTVMHLLLEQRRVASPGGAKELKPLHETLSTTMQQVRALGRSLSSEVLEQNGLLRSVQAEVARLQQIGSFEVLLDTDAAEPLLNKDQRLMVFRIFQEITNNMMKHANAHKVSVIFAGRDTFFLQVSDDGQGFDVEAVMKEGSGSGMRNIARRAALAGLRSNISSEQGKGSTFTLQLSDTLLKPGGNHD